MSQKNKSLGLLSLISIGIGGMVGGGIFAVLGEAVSLAHGATPIAFGVAGVVALLTLLLHTYHSNPQAVIIFFGFIIISGLFELIYGRYIRKHMFGREYKIFKNKKYFI